MHLNNFLVVLSSLLALGSAYLDPIQLTEVPDIAARAPNPSATPTTIATTLDPAVAAVAAEASPSGTPFIVVKADPAQVYIGHMLSVLR
jgi:hypothetical protein